VSGMWSSIGSLQLDRAAGAWLVASAYFPADMQRLLSLARVHALAALSPFAFLGP
jgi:hypothetical protein